MGVVLALVGLPLLLAGLGLAWAVGTQRDADGFFSTPTERFTTPTAALTSTTLQLGEASPNQWWVDDDLMTVRLRATSTDTPVFVGIGPSNEVRDYLGTGAYEEISDLRADPFEYSLVRRGGEGAPAAAPTQQPFWTTQSSGNGTQSVTWNLAPGSYTAVVMNADGSPGVAADLTAGGRVTMLVPLAWSLGLAGLLFVLAGALLVVYGARAPSSGGGSSASVASTNPGDSALVAGAAGALRSPVTLTGYQDDHLSRWLWLVKWLLAIPHLIVLALLWLVFTVLTVVAFFAILITGRYPRGLFDLNVGILRWTWRVQFYATNAIGTDRYPPFTLEHAEYPADLDIEYTERLSRGLVLVKWWLLAIPHLIVLAVLAGTWTLGDDDGFQLSIGGLIGALTLAAGLMLLFAGRYPAALFDFLVGLNRWVYRVIAYVALMTDRYPPFRLDQGPTEPSPASAPTAPPAPTSASMPPPGDEPDGGAAPSGSANREWV